MDGSLGALTTISMDKALVFFLIITIAKVMEIIEGSRRMVNLTADLISQSISLLSLAVKCRLLRRLGQAEPSDNLSSNNNKRSARFFCLIICGAID